MSNKRWMELYQAYGPLIYAKCRKILADDAAAEDASQETFIRAYTHLDKVKSSSEALPWIYRIATHYCLNELRNGKQKAEPVGELPDSPGAHAEETFGSRDFLIRLMERVPESVRVVAWLHHMEGLNQVQVAQVLGVSRRTVVYRLATLAEAATRLRDERTHR
ncbi:sigma-70 family RNA polymerase sigma factor [Myxococcus sp. AM009]|uniref:RNA polymerase sigma factor n=1 Tax=unclassified Myxococcus TaxID=2648731 RepID=UPI0015951748|nr:MULTISPECIES: sigma-70 family RNA polymerase sigma factor [unclassified Myxococcus]NVJ03213.1 sigma-70 family RNA polymerase sigma factor [Myxococcus sp. AM009]NVJ15696.1 sigma-70 family RNA polymerase sigma factor [Myxococcus sp. AM010]